MKRTINILILFTFLSLSGCWTKVYLGKEKEPDMTFSDEMVMSSRAIDPTTVPAGGTWGTVRGILNTNFGNINGTLDSIEVITTEHDAVIDTIRAETLEIIDTLVVHRTELDGKLDLSDSVTIYSTQYDLLSGLATKQNTLVSGTSIKTINSQTLLGSGNITIEGGAGETDSTVYATRYYTGTTFAPIANPIFTGVQKVSTTDTLATQAYARQFGGTGTVTMSDVQGEIADSLNALRPLTLVGDGTQGPFFDGSSDGGQMLYFYGDNGFYTALQGGAPTANRLYRLPIAALPGAGTTSLINIDENGNMGFVASSSVVKTADTTGTAAGSYVSGYTFQQGMINKVTASDSLDVYATPKQISDSLSARIGAGVPIADIAVMQVDSLTKYVTPKQLSDSLSAFVGGTGITSGEVATQINDSLTARLLSAVEGIRLVDSIGNAPGNYVTHKALSDSITANLGGAVGLTLNGGSITLTGDLATADDVTFYTNGDGEYNLPTGGGNLTIQSQVQGWINDSLDVLRTADSDTIPLFVFGLGSGHSSDTAVFNNGRLAGAFYNSGSDTLYVTELRGVLVEGTGTETIAVQVSWDVNMKDGTPTNLNTTALTVTSMTTGTADTTFDNNGIPPDTWVWCTLSGASANNKPTMLILTMTGFKRNRSY